MRQSKVLIITICSNEKNKGGDVYNLESPSIVKILPEHSDGIIQRRLKALELIQSGVIGRDGIKLNELPFNSSLIYGPEFGGKSSGSTQYMQALDRYDGRFYKSLKSGDKDIIEESPHHLLIISGLYGLVLPDELIQCYSCNIDDDAEFASIWTDGNFLTSIILAYMNKFKIDTVFDLIAQESYRRFLHWERIEKKAKVLHVFGEQLVGPALLFTLGILAKEKLLVKTDEDLKTIEINKMISVGNDRLIFTQEPFPPEGFPKECENKPIEEESLYAQELAVQMPSVEKEEDITGTEKRKEEILLLDHSREIRVTSRCHKTIFGKMIDNINDLPQEIREVVREISRCPEVIDIIFERMKKAGPSCDKFRFRLLSTKIDSGRIDATVEGNGKVCHTQYVGVHVTKGYEQRVFKVLKDLLDQKT